MNKMNSFEMGNNSSDLENYVKQFKNLVFFGTAHVSRKTKHLLNTLFDAYDFDAIALELDINRFNAILTNSKPRFDAYFKMGFLGILFYFLSKWQRNLAKKYNTTLASEMRDAALFAFKQNLPLYLIDMPIEITMKKLKQEFKLSLIFRLIVDAFKKEKVSLPNDYLDLSWDFINKYMNKIKTRYPEIYKVLIEDRNKYMALQLKQIMNMHNLILVIVGKGHVNGIIDELKKLESK